MARGDYCEVHKHDYLVPQEVHHIWPRGYHGPDTDDNKIKICSNAHSDIHYLMEAMLKGKKVDKRLFGPGVRKYAQKGYDAVIAYGESLSK